MFPTLTVTTLGYGIRRRRKVARKK